MNSKEAGIAMPELARTIIDKEGVQLIKDWINKMSMLWFEFVTASA